MRALHVTHVHGSGLELRALLAKPKSLDAIVAHRGCPWMVRHLRKGTLGVSNRGSIRDLFGKGDRCISGHGRGAGIVWGGGGRGSATLIGGRTLGAFGQTTLASPGADAAGGHVRWWTIGFVIRWGQAHPPKGWSGEWCWAEERLLQRQDMAEQMDRLCAPLARSRSLISWRMWSRSAQGVLELQRPALTTGAVVIECGADARDQSGFLLGRAHDMNFFAVACWKFALSVVACVLCLETETSNCVEGMCRVGV